MREAARHKKEMLSRFQAYVIRTMLLLFVLSCPGLSCVCQSNRDAAIAFIRSEQKMTFKEQGLDASIYRKQQLDLLQHQLPELGELFKDPEKLPSDYEDPSFLILDALMSKISVVGPKYLKEVGVTPIGDPPMIATFPTRLAAPATEWHDDSQTNILRIDGATNAFVVQLANQVAESIPLRNGRPVLGICGIRPRINKDSELQNSFKSLLEAYVYRADLQSVQPFIANDEHRLAAITQLYEPALFFVLAHEYVHAALRHTTDPKEQFPNERKAFSSTFYTQMNEQTADHYALAIESKLNFGGQDALAGAWLFLKGHEILHRALAVAATGNEFTFGHTGFPGTNKPLLSACGNHPFPDVRLTNLEFAGRLAWGPSNDDVFCPAYSIDWILEYLWTIARPTFQQKYKDGERPNRQWTDLIRCYERASSASALEPMK